MKRLLQVLLVALCIFAPVLEPKASSVIIETQQATVVNLLYELRLHGEEVPDGTLCYLFSEQGEQIAVLESMDSKIQYQNLPFGRYYMKVSVAGATGRMGLVADLAYMDTQNTYKVFELMPSGTGNDGQEVSPEEPHKFFPIETGDEANLVILVTTLLVSVISILMLWKRRCQTHES